jgi:uncharacterized membrane protein
MADPHASHWHSQHQVIYQQVVRAPSNGMAVAALVLGLVSIVLGVWIPVPILGLFMMFVAFVPALLAIVFGHISLRRSMVVGVGRGASLSGLILGYVTVALSVMTTAFWVVTAAASSSAASESALIG